MRAGFYFAIILSCCIFSLVLAQNGQTVNAKAAHASTFMLEIIELEIPDSDEATEGSSDSRLTAEDVVRLAKRSGGTDRQRRLFRLSAVDGIEAFAQVAETVPTVVGKTIHDGQTTFDYEDTRVGTKLRATVSATSEGHVRVRLSLATSAVSLKDDGTRPDLSTLSANFIESELELGRPTLLKTVATGRTSAVVFTITRIEARS
ncbi:hypothetical protein ACFL2H_00370 [Planctomycetota bacterium]